MLCHGFWLMGRNSLFLELLCSKACPGLHLAYAIGSSFNNFDEQNTVRFFSETTPVRGYLQLICALVRTMFI